MLPFLCLIMACNREKQEMQPVNPQEKGVTYSFRAEMEASKASVDDDGICSWNENDEIAVYDAVSSSFITFTSPYGDGVFSFVGVPDTEYEFTHAFYPASVAKAAQSITLPEAYTLSQSKEGNLFPMLGSIDGNKLVFRHLAALLRYTIAGIPSTADRIVVSSQEVSLSGEFPLEGSGLDDGWTYGEGEDATVNENVDVKAGETLREIHARSGSGKVTISITPGENRTFDFFVPLPIGAYSCTVKLMEGDNVLQSKTTNTLKDVERARLIKMRTINLTFSGGAGTEEAPYLISTPLDLQDMVTAFEQADDTHYSSAYYKQTSDIDMSSVSDFSPIGSVDNPLSGTYDGDHHVISNITIYQEGNCAGLFGYMREGTVKNVTLAHANITAETNYAGGITGVLYNGTIANCKTDEETIISAGVRGAGSMAGLMRSGVVNACASHSGVYAGTDVAGGMVGYVYPNTDSHDALIINCTYEPVYKNGTIYVNSATVQTSAKNAYMGGIAGSANAAAGRIRIANCYSYPLRLRTTLTNSETISYVGGILGRIVAGDVTVFNCISPVTYSNIVYSGSRLNAKGWASHINAACIVGSIDNNGSTIQRVFSKNTWPKSFNLANGKTVNAANVTLKMGDSNMRGYGDCVFSDSYTISGAKTYTAAEGGVLAALNAGVAEWNTDNSATPALTWALDPTFGYPKPAGVDVAGQLTKKISLIGDSISTYQGYIFSNDDQQMNKFYPDTGNSYSGMVLTEQSTWWWKLIYGKMQNARLEVANAFGGSTVSYLTEKVDGMAKDPNDRMQENSIQKRYLDYGVGEPDILIFHGGRNDFGQFGGNTDVLVGTYDDASLQAAYDASEGTLFGNFAAGTVAVLRDFHAKFPNAKVLIIVHDMMSDGYEDAAMAVTAFMNAKGCNTKCVSLHERGTNNATNTTLGITKEGGTHPNNAGCTNMANYIYEQAGAWMEE